MDLKENIEETFFIDPDSFETDPLDMPESLFNDAPPAVKKAKGQGNNLPPVKSLRSAISLADQVAFQSRLFRKDSSLYQSTVDHLDNLSTMAEAQAYLADVFPEWDQNFDDVRRFMAAVSRKIRK